MSSDTMEREVSPMKNEALILNLICVVLAIVFVGLAALNFISAGNFLTIDSLFFTTVCMLLALLFIVSPLMALMEAGILPNPLKIGSSEETQSATAPRPAKGTAALPSSTGTNATAATASARIPVKKVARDVPPDVEKMMAQMKGTPPKDS